MNIIIVESDLRSEYKMIHKVQAQSKTNPVKTAVKTAASAAVAAGTILYLAKKGKLNPAKGDSLVIKNVKAGLKKPADFILKKSKNVKSSIIAQKGKNPGIDFVIDKTKKVKNFAEMLKDKISYCYYNVAKNIDTYKDIVESKSNNLKFLGK